MKARKTAKAWSLDPRLASQIIDEALEYAIFTMDAEGLILTWNPGGQRVLGYSAAEAVGMNFSALFTPSDLEAGADRAELEVARREGRAEDSRWHVRKGGDQFWANGVTMILHEPEHGLLKILRDDTRAKMAEEQRILLLNELNHRIKNTLATVQSIAEQTLRASEVDPATREDLAKRLIALSEAHNVLVAENWAGADLRTIVTKVLAPHQHAEIPLFEVHGPAVRLSSQQSVAMSLALHELATNAIKHGALQTPSGRVAITWAVSRDEAGTRHLELLWEERGGPPVTPPRREGFGSRLIARSFSGESEGESRIEYRPEGVRCVIRLSLAGARDLPIMHVGRGGPEDPS